jgi:hypothetical protein
MVSFFKHWWAVGINIAFTAWYPVEKLLVWAEHAEFIDHHAPSSGSMLEFLKNPPGWLPIPIALLWILIVLQHKWPRKKPTPTFADAAAKIYPHLAPKPWWKRIFAIEPPPSAGRSEAFIEFLRLRAEQNRTLMHGLSAEHRAAVQQLLDESAENEFNVRFDKTGLLPICRVVEHVAMRINDSDENQCYPTTLKALRQRAADGSLRMRGRKQLDVKGQKEFRDIHTDVPKEYWTNSTLTPMATSVAYTTDIHTRQDAPWAWGPRGVDEPNQYSDLRVEWADVLRLWP